MSNPENKLEKCKTSTVKSEISCVICDSKNPKAIYKYSYQKNISHIFKCQNCTHLFMHPVPLIDLKSRNMDAISDAEFFGNNLLKNLQEKIVINKEIKIIKKMLAHIPNPKLLDIGCGTGWTTSIWKDNNFSVVGLESSVQRGKYCTEKYGIPIINKHIEEFNPEEKFDIVIMRHLLEHIEQPDKILKKVRTFLKEDGVLLIIIPNINSIGRYIFKENWEWILPWHLHFYTPRTLTALLEKEKFKKYKLYQMPSPLWYPSSFSNALGRESFFGKFFSTHGKLITLLLFSPVILLGMILGMNDNMTLIFKKGKKLSCTA